MKTLLLGALSILVFGIASAQAADNCTAASLNGGFASRVFGQAQTGPTGAGPFASAGRWNFDGAGNVTVVETVNYNGTVNDYTLTGTYTVDGPNCKAAVSFTSGELATVYLSGSAGTNASVIVRVPNYVVASGTLTR